MTKYLITASTLALLLQAGAAYAENTTVFRAGFLPTAFVTPPKLVDCTLSDGSSGECYKMTVDSQPDEFTIEPFCPATTADAGGLWQWDGDEAGLYRIDGDFLKMLDAQGFHFYDADGKVSITDVRLDRPKGTNSCLSASLDAGVTMTMLIPAAPKMADTPSDLGTVAKVGVALDGVPIFADAPSVLQTGHMPALDVCGGHIDPGGWYHWHATASDIETPLNAAKVTADCTLTQAPSAQFGYAFDGFAMFGSLETDGSTPKDLDQCGGHKDESAAGYHYHSSDRFPNLPTCLVGVTAEDNFSTTAAQGIGSANAGPGPGHEMDLDAVAKALGVDATALREALGPQGQRPDFAAAAQKLGISEADLQAALPAPPPQ